MRKVVIIGGNSYLASGLERYLSDCNVIGLFYHNWQDNLDIIRKADCVINFSISPQFSTRDMELEEILDIQIAKSIKNSATRFVFISSRKVYGTNNECLCHTEDDALIGTDFYSHNKIKTEQALQNILGDRICILRVSNIIGEPVVRSGYKTFVGWMCESYLNSGQLIVTQNANAKKDFITKDFAQECCAAFIKDNISGIFNVSSGFATSVSDVLTGYIGEDNVVFGGQASHCSDQFILDNSKLKKSTGKNITREQINEYLKECHNKVLELKEQYVITQKGA